MNFKMKNVNIFENTLINQYGYSNMKCGVISPHYEHQSRNASGKFSLAQETAVAS